MDLTESSLIIWGLALQNATLAVIIPLYLFVHLSTSPTTASTDPTLFLIEPIDLASVVISLILSYILLLILVALPAPSLLSFDQKQIVLAIWQLFPVWTELLHQGTVLLLRNVMSQDKTSKPVTATNRRDPPKMGGLRSVYIFLVFIAGSTHIATLTLMATSKWFPRLFAIGYEGVFNPSKVFWPVAASTSIKMSSIGSGILMMIQYDAIISSLAIVLWAVFLFTNAMSQKKKFETAYVFIFDFITLTALLGPMGYTVVCIWARDEMIFEDQKGREGSIVEKMGIVEPNPGEKTKLAKRN